MKKIGLCAAALCALFVGQTANAAFQVTLGVDAASTTIVDGGVGDNDGVVNGMIDVSSTVGAYTFTTVLSTTNSPGGFGIAFVDTGTNMISGSGAATLSIYVNSMGFTTPSSPPTLSALTSGTVRTLALNTGSVSSASVTSYFDTTNAASTTATGTVIGTASLGAPLTGGGKVSSFSTASFPFIGATPYALNLEVLATVTGSGSHVLDLDGGALVAVPEPGTMILWGSFAAMGVPAAIRRRRNKTA